MSTNQGGSGCASSGSGGDSTQRQPPFKGLLVSQDRAVLHVTINRPKTKNAINDATYRELARALDVAARDASVAIAVLSGAGDYFCSGTDLHEFVATLPPGSMDASARRFEARDASASTACASDDGRSDESAENDRSDGTPASAGGSGSGVAMGDPFATPVGSFMLAVLRFPKILIAAVNGPAVGIGVTLLPHCDLVFAAQRASFWTPFLRIALVPEFGSSLTLPRVLGPALANDMLLAQRVLSAEEATRHGLVARVFPDDRLMAEVQAIVDEMQSQPLFQHSLLLFKRMLQGDISGSSGNPLTTNSSKGCSKGRGRRKCGDSDGISSGGHSSQQQQMEAVVAEELHQVARRKASGETGHALAVTLQRMGEAKAGAGGSKSRL